MKNWAAGLGLATMAALASPQAFAASYYLSDCQTGAAAGCVSGNDGADGRTAAAPRRNVSALPALVAGDTVYFAKGGGWTFSSAGWGATFAKDSYVSGISAGTYQAGAAVITYTSYQAAWCSSGACLTQRPVLNAALNAGLVGFTNGGLSRHKEGATMRGLELRAGAGSTSIYTAGIGIYNDSDYLVFDDMEISGFGMGISIQGINTTETPGTDSDGYNDHITIKNSYIHNNLTQGFLGFANDLLIENNTFDRNGGAGVPSNGDHNVYLAGNPGCCSGPYTQGKRAVVRGNTLTRSSLVGGVCTGVSLTLHNTWTDVVIENNTIDETGTEGGGCYGIDIVAADVGPERLTNIAVRGNRVINAGNIGIGMGSCINCTVENNVVVFLTARTDASGIVLPSKPKETDDAAQQAVIVRNNSIYIANGNANTVGIQLDTYGTNHKVTSNLIYFGAGSVAGHRCFKAGPLSMFDAFDSNLCYDASPFYRWSPTYPTLATAQAAGFDARGLSVNPLFTAAPGAGNGYSMALSANSPAIGAGNPTASALQDFSGRVRGARPDIGASQFGSTATTTVPPSAPTGVMAR